MLADRSTSSRATLRRFDRSPHLARSDAKVEEDLPGGGVVSCQEGQRDVLDPDVAVLEPDRLTQRELETTLGLAAERPVPGRTRAVPPPPPKSVPWASPWDSPSLKCASPEGRLRCTANLAQIDSQRPEQAVIVAVTRVRPDHGGNRFLERLRASTTIPQEHRNWSG